MEVTDGVNSILGVMSDDPPPNNKLSNDRKFSHIQKGHIMAKFTGYYTLNQFLKIYTFCPIKK